MNEFYCVNSVDSKMYFNIVKVLTSHFFGRMNCWFFLTFERLSRWMSSSLIKKWWFFLPLWRRCKTTKLKAKIFSIYFFALRWVMVRYLIFYAHLICSFFRFRLKLKINKYLFTKNFLESWFFFLLLLLPNPVNHFGTFQIYLVDPLWGSWPPEVEHQQIKTIKTQNILYIFHVLHVSESFKGRIFVFCFVFFSCLLLYPFDLKNITFICNEMQRIAFS